MTKKSYNGFVPVLEHQPVESKIMIIYATKLTKYSFFVKIILNLWPINFSINRSFFSAIFLTETKK